MGVKEKKSFWKIKADILINWYLPRLKKDGLNIRKFKSLSDWPISPESFNKLAFIMYLSQGE